MRAERRREASCGVKRRNPFEEKNPEGRLLPQNLRAAAARGLAMAYGCGAERQ